MAVKENGVLMNGSTPKPSRQQPQRRSRAKPSSSGTSAWIISTTARSLIWYILTTCIFRCPSSPTNLAESSPQLCKPYLASISYLKPYAEPYYNTYAAPYVERARPYAAHLNRTVITPATQFTKQNYESHAAPRLAGAKAYNRHQWETSILPRVETAQKRVNEIYGSSIAPTIAKTLSFAEPYYGVARDKAVFIQDNHVLPALKTSKPYFLDAYASSQSFLLETAIPFARWAWSSTVIFADGTLWPLLRSLYGDNVKPQLVLISERIARYQEGRRIKASMGEVEILTSTEAVPQETIPESPPSTEEPPAVQSKLSGQEKIAAARPRVAADLRSWQEKFATAADKGSEDLQERVSEIIGGLIKTEVDNAGHGLLSTLSDTAKTELVDFKAEIILAVTALADENSGSDEEAAEKQLQDSIRRCATNIRERASAVREWHTAFKTKVAHLATVAAESTVDVLNGIRDLGLQEIGMRWAWMDGITYKDWAKYHELKKQLDVWREEVREVATKHEMISQAKQAADNVLDSAMETASDAAKELVRLKDVGKWKIQARDSSDNFESRPIHADAPSPTPIVAGNSSDISQDVADGSLSASKASDVAENVKDTAFSVARASDQEDQEAMALKSTEASGQTASSLPISDVHSGDETIDSIASGYTDTKVAVISDVTSEGEAVASSRVQGDPVGSLQTASSQLADSMEFAEEFGTSAVESPGGDDEPLAHEVQSSAFSKINMGAMAQEVSAGQPILDDMVEDSDGSTFSESLQGVVNEAGDQYAEVTKAVMEAIMGSPQGTRESLSSVATEQYSSALATASSILYGSSQRPDERMTSIASDKYGQAVLAASAAIFGTQTPVRQSLASQASAAYDDAVRRASQRYDQAKSAVSAQISGKPLDLNKEARSSIDSAYTALEAASRHYAFLTDTAKSFASTSTQTPLESISSVASLNLQHALSLASAQYAGMKEAAGPTPAPLNQQHLQDAEQKYYAAKGLAHERYSDFVNAASTAVYGIPLSGMNSVSRAASQVIYGTPTPVLSSISGAASQAAYGSPDPAYQTAISEATSRFAASSSLAVSNLEAFLASAMGGTAESTSQGMVDQASIQYSIALSEASGSLSAAMYAASTAVYDTPAEALESAASRASENWDALISKASEQIYGAPTPFFASLASQAGEHRSQVTDAAALHYTNVQAFVSELIIGKEPDFTESVMSRLSSAYHTDYEIGLASSASSFAGEAYHAASSVASSASSVASSASATYFTPPPQIEHILSAASKQLDGAVDAASVQIYGTSKGVFEQAKSGVAERYSSVSSAASQSIYSTQAGHADIAQSSLSSAMSSAQEAISKAIYGTSTGSVESMSSVAGQTYSSVSSVAVENVIAAGQAAGGAYSSAAARVSEVIYGPEQNAMQSAQNRLTAAVQSAQARVADFSLSVGRTATEAVEAAQRNVEGIADSASSAADSITSHAKDEL